MAKTITIPTNKGNPIQVVINGKRYKYTAGASESVPDEVAALFGDNQANEPVTGGDTTDLEKIEALAARVDAAEEDIDDLQEAVEDLDERVTALEPEDETPDDTTESEGT